MLRCVGASSDSNVILSLSNLSKRCYAALELPMILRVARCFSVLHGVFRSSRCCIPAVVIAPVCGFRSAHLLSALCSVLALNISVYFGNVFRISGIGNLFGISDALASNSHYDVNYQATIRSVYLGQL